MNEKIYTEQEASKVLRISMTTLWRERKAGKIFYRRIGGRIRYTQKDLRDYLDSNKRGGFAFDE
jgi:predicted site-specific integrase-resolvase